MLRAFTYRDEDVASVIGTPDHSLRLANVEVVSDPEVADVIVVPVTLMHIKSRSQMEQLPLWSRFESKHVFFDCSDFEWTYGGTSATLIRCNLREWMLATDRNSMSWFWPVEDYAECIEPPDGGCLYDVGFHGWMSTKTRVDSTNACKRLKSDIVQYHDFTGYIYDQPEGIRRRAAFRKNLRESLLQLCPESIPGVFPYRFFEAMSAGRVPVLFSSGYVLPFQDRIPWDEISVRFPADEASSAADRIEFWLSGKTPEDVLAMGRKGRAYWEQWLDARRNSELWTIALESAL